MESAAVGLMAARFAAAEALGAQHRPAAAHDRAWRAARACHRPARGARRERARLPADEHQFRPLPADRPAGRDAETASASAAPQRRWRGSARSRAARSATSSMARRDPPRRRLITPVGAVQIEINRRGAQRELASGCLAADALHQQAEAPVPKRKFDEERRQQFSRLCSGDFRHPLIDRGAQHRRRHDDAFGSRHRWSSRAELSRFGSPAPSTHATTRCPI